MDVCYQVHTQQQPLTELNAQSKRMIQLNDMHCQVNYQSNGSFIFNQKQVIFYREEMLKQASAKKAEEEKFILKKELQNVPLLRKANGSMKTITLPLKYTKQLTKL